MTYAGVDSEACLFGTSDFLPYPVLNSQLLPSTLAKEILDDNKVQGFCSMSTMVPIEEIISEISSRYSIIIKDQGDDRVCKAGIMRLVHEAPHKVPADLVAAAKKGFTFYNEGKDQLPESSQLFWKLVESSDKNQLILFSL